MKTLTLTTGQQVNVAIKPIDGDGKPLDLVIAPRWTSEGCCQVLPAANGLSAVIVAAEVADKSLVTVSIVANVGAGDFYPSEEFEVITEGVGAANLGLVLPDVPAAKEVFTKGGGAAVLVAP